ncbi:cadherin-like domain-containing protein [Legionella quateirensis]|uniref:cadherin-like domain-containing protein n=1 Tax=Legionella quateirensis TaxID=45072 RepID=UPI000E0EF530|nr:cadherin-like domain-containing protein [Legionella quateirensis]
MANYDVNNNDTFEKQAIPSLRLTVRPLPRRHSGCGQRTVLLNANGTLSFTPAANYNGSTSFTYTVTSGGVTETATVNVTVTR